MRKIPTLNLVLFVVTCFFVLLSGALMEGADPFSEFASILAGLPFAFALMLILLSHELSHYVASMRHNVEATLPYFIPIPPIPGMITIGTFGAFIKMRSPIVTRSALVDIGASGPIVGFLVSIVATVYGLMNSSIQVVKAGTPTLMLGDSILFSSLSHLIFGAVPEGMDVFLHPVAFAGWLGFFVTSLNLIPVGQLDGGHILYAFVGQRHLMASRLLVAALAVMGILYWEGWMIWAVLLLILKLNHPPVIYWEPTLPKNRKIIGIIALVIFVLTFTPSPFAITGLPVPPLP